LRRAVHFRDLRALLKSFSTKGFKPTVRKALWALGTRGIYLPLNQNVPFRELVTDLPKWKAADLEQRAKTLRSYPPKSNFRAFAFYLPQFHTIPENNAWWGDGFTEWTNVKKAQKFFENHYQPHIPLDDNYYDLSNPEVMREQARIAKLFGLDAFVMYYYWFEGTKLLDTPLENLMSDPTIDFPFVLCWANESWTRNWDGQPNQILIEQSYGEGFAIKFITEVSRHFYDSRYETFEGKPILLVYRPELIPNIIQTSEIWRKHVKSMGFSDVYLISVNSFESVDPRSMGFDAATNFAPNNMGLTPKKDHGFPGKIYDYDELTNVEQPISKQYPLYRSVTPSWDNTARRGSAGSVIQGSSPSLFRDWLFNEASITSQTSLKEGERILFVNAWNEWAEGCHLEADEYHGYQWLHSLADVKEEMYLQQFNPLHREKTREIAASKFFDGVATKKHITKEKIILVVHDLNANGAQMNGLALLKEFRLKSVEVELISLGSGKLRQEFLAENDGNLFILEEKSEEELHVKLQEMRSRGFCSAIFNSAASGKIAKFVHSYEIKIISLIHEFPETISHYKLEKSAVDLAKYSDLMVFPSEMVLNEFKQKYNIESESIIQPQGLYNVESLIVHPEWQNTQTRIDLDIPLSSRIVMGLGYGDHRKGFDIFCDVAKELKEKSFIWVGDLDTNDPRIKKSLNEKPDNLRVTGFSSEISRYFSIADCLLLTSRRDPFPSVVLEALGRGIPVVAIHGNTGMDDLLNSLNLPTSKSENATELLSLINSTIETFSTDESEKSRKHIHSQFNFRKYASKLLNFADITPKTVTVLVPNYNYAEYLINRLDQIENQSYSIDNLILVDDLSTDKSFEIAKDFLNLSRIPNCLIQNEKNTKSPFSSWVKIADLAETDFFWIAEVDDVASGAFAEELLNIFSGVEGMVYCNSAQISSTNEILARDFAEFLSPVYSRNFQRAYFADGIDEIKNCLAIQNTIPNVSSVMFRLEALKSIGAKFEEYGQGLKTAADWLLYVLILENSSIAYTSKTLNAQRRHTSSVIGSSEKSLLVEEISRIQTFIESRHSLSPDVIELREKFRKRVHDQ
jgi:glycosyltransferase involved in cell wall biosynthesis